MASVSCTNFLNIDEIYRRNAPYLFKIAGTSRSSEVACQEGLQVFGYGFVKWTGFRKQNCSMYPLAYCFFAGSNLIS
jgi:hypothetical protein